MGVKFPYADATVLTLTATGAQALTIDNMLTIVDGVAVEATGDRTLNLTIDAELPIGALALVETKANGTEDTIFGTGITSVTVTGTAGKTNTQLFVFNGTAFVPGGLTTLID